MYKKWKIRYASNGSAKEQVIAQLEDDYPEDKMQWIHDADWSGPQTVNIKDIDSSKRKTWAAYHEPKKVNKWMKRIEDGNKKPVSLVKTPKNDKYIIIDGHHRFLAYEKLKQDPVCWIGSVDKESGPWDTFHNEQNAREAADK